MSFWSNIMLCNFFNLEILLEHQIFWILALSLPIIDNTNVMKVGSDLRNILFFWLNFKREKRPFVNFICKKGSFFIIWGDQEASSWCCKVFISMFLSKHQDSLKRYTTNFATKCLIQWTTQISRMLIILNALLYQSLSLIKVNWLIISYLIYLYSWRTFR